MRYLRAQVDLVVAIAEEDKATLFAKVTECDLVDACILEMRM